MAVTNEADLANNPLARLAGRHILLSDSKEIPVAATKSFELQLWTALWTAQTWASCFSPADFRKTAAAARLAASVSSKVCQWNKPWRSRVWLTSSPMRVDLPWKTTPRSALTRPARSACVRVLGSHRLARQISAYSAGMHKAPATAKAKRPSRASNCQSARTSRRTPCHQSMGSLRV